MTDINLDEARAARAEKLDERSFTFKGERFELPAELPYAALGPLGHLVENEMDLLAIRATMVALLGEETHDRFERLGPSITDLNELVAGIFRDYDLGKPATNGASGELDPKPQPS
jgi:hypothetical protein